MEKLYENSEELKSLNKELKELKKERRKYRFKSGLRFSAGFGTALGVLLATPLTTSVIGTCLGYSPFIRDDVVREAHIKTEFNSEGERNVSKKYEPYEDEKSLVHYHTGWVEAGDQYVSEVTTYDASKVSYDAIDECMKSGSDVSDVLGAPILSEKIYKDTLTEKEKVLNPYYEGVIYTVDSSDTTISPQTLNENAEDWVIFAYLPGFAGLVPTFAFGCDLAKKICEKCERYDKRVEFYNGTIKKTKDKKRSLVMELKKNSV